jgi:hypothetical protein
MVCFRWAEPTNTRRFCGVLTACKGSNFLQVVLEGRAAQQPPLWNDSTCNGVAFVGAGIVEDVEQLVERSPELLFEP